MLSRAFCLAFLALATLCCSGIKAQGTVPGAVKLNADNYISEIVNAAGSLPAIIAFQPTKAAEEAESGDEVDGDAFDVEAWKKKVDKYLLGNIGVHWIGYVLEADIAGVMELLALTEADDEPPVFLVYDHGDKDVSAFEEFEEYAEAKAAAAASIPDLTTHEMNEVSYQAFVAQAIQDEAIPVVLFTEKRETPAIFKAIAFAFRDYKFAFGTYVEPGPQIMQNYQIPKLPHLSILIANKEFGKDKDESVKLSFAHYDTKAYGPLKFIYIARWLNSFATQFNMEIPSSGAEQADQRQRPDEIPPLVELADAASAQAACSESRKALCVVALMDGKPALAEERQRLLAEFRTVQESVASRQFHFMWIDAACHAEWLDAFAIDPSALPSVVVISPAYRVLARYVDPFQKAPMIKFLTRVLKSRMKKNVSPFSQMPLTTDRDCAAHHAAELEAAAAADADADMDMESFLRELREEEEARERALQEDLAREREEEEAAEAAARAAAAAPKKKKKKNKKKKRSAPKEEL